MKHPGISVRHSRSCPAASDTAARCRCRPSYRASVYDRRSGRKIRKSFPTLAEARAWRRDVAAAVGRGTVRAPSRVTVREAMSAMLDGMAAGTVRTRSGDAYKPSVIRSYSEAWRKHLEPALGGARLADVERRDVQRLADKLLAAGLSPSRIRNVLMPLRVLFRRAVQDGDVAMSPCERLRLPALRGRRDRIVSAEEAARLIDALPRAEDRAAWATALYAGLRAGELAALDWEHVDLAAGVIRVERSWDPKAGVFVEPKSRAGRRSVPLAAVLRDILIEHKLATGRSEGLVFGDGSRPLDAKTLTRRAVRAWGRYNERETLAAEREGRKPRLLEPIGLHEARHTFASLMIAAGVNAKALSTYLGHSSIQITFDRYGHLMPGNEEEAAGLLDAYLARADTRARLAQLD
jgi:integrase